MFKTSYICRVRTSVDIRPGSNGLSKLTSEFGQVAYLNSNDVHNRSLLAVGKLRELVIEASASADPFSLLRQFRTEVNDWIFGYLAYDLRHYTTPRNADLFRTYRVRPVMRFFQPEFLIEWTNGKAKLWFDPLEMSLEKVRKFIKVAEGEELSPKCPVVGFKQIVSRATYIDSVRQIQREIQHGNMYEMNYCMPFKAHIQDMNTATLYHHLNARTQAPFSVYYLDSDHALMCGSPERYLQMRGGKLKAQPIKGTIRRGNGEEDVELIQQLRNDPKERAENVMITDLVRNDLSRVAARESVRVDELCGIYTFKTVHQMISTISADLAHDKDGIDALRATFPMGSMTGAPKVSAMQYIDQFEKAPRGIYSGAFGYFEPNGDFDFNVIIRSMVYDRNTSKLSFHVGSAITSLSDPEKEYEECLLKAEALLKATKAEDYVA